MNRNPLYSFTDLTSRGIDKLPLNTVMQIIDIDGDPSNGAVIPKMIQITSKDNVNELTTIAQFLSMPGNYINLAQMEVIPSELEKLGTGWRILGREASSYGPLGSGAIDFSKSTNVITLDKPYGAIGIDSFASGYKTFASGSKSIAQGWETKAINEASFAAGKFNIGTDTGNILEIGIGTAPSNRRNAFEITDLGVIIAPEMTIADIDSTGISALVTKEYSDANLDSKVNKTGDTITGELIIEADALNTTLHNKGISLFDQVVTFKESITIGLDQGTPVLSRVNFSDIVSTSNPGIYWNTSLKNFFLDTDLIQGAKIWHGANDGINSGLDADTIHGISGTQLYTITQIDSELSTKLNITGGTISGNLGIQGTTTMFTSTIGDLTVNGTSTLNGSVNINSALNVSEDLTIQGNLVVDVITSSPRFTGSVDFDNTIEAGGLITVNAGLLINHNGSRNSVIQFQDANIPTVHRSIFWSSDDSSFMVNPDGTNAYTMWHSGNLSASNLVQTFDDLTDTPNIKEPGKYLQVSSDGNSIEYGLIDNTSASWGAINGILGDQTDLQTSLNLKLNKTGGSISGGLIVSGDISTAGTLTAQTGFISYGIATINGSLAVTDIITDVTFSGSIIAANSISSLEDISAGGNLIVGLDSNGYSGVLYEPSGGTTPYIYWDTNDNLFKVTDSYGIGQEISHSGNSTNSDKYDATGGDITGDVYITANLTDPITYGYGDLKVQRNTTLEGSLEAQADSIFLGTAQFNSDVDLQGNTSATTLHTGTLSVTGATNVSTINATGDVDIGGTTSMIGAVSLGSTITVSGNTTVASISSTGMVVDSGVAQATSIVFTDLPISDPGVPGQLWDNVGVLSISQ